MAIYSSMKQINNDVIIDDLKTSKQPIQSLRPNISCSHSVIDTHIHSQYSLDGYKTVDEIVERAKQNGTRYISITDHNSVSAFHDLMRSEKRRDNEVLYNYDGVDILCGSEVTCYMPLADGKRVKFHLLCYGFDRSDKSITKDVIDSKYNDYKQSQYGLMYYLAKYNPAYKTSMTEFKQYMREYIDKTKFSGCLTPNIAIDYYKWKGFDEAKIAYDLKNYDPYLARRDKVHINIFDLIDMVHNDGGLCVLAHPTTSISKFGKKTFANADPFTMSTMMTNELLLNGLDGVEVANVYNEKMYHAINYNAYIKSTLKDSYIVSCGSDFHYFDDDKYKDLSFKDIGKFNRLTDLSSVNLSTKIAENEKRKRLELTDKNKQKQEVNTNRVANLRFTYKEKPKDYNNGGMQR